METPRFNYNGRPDVASRIRPWDYPPSKWIRIPNVTDPPGRGLTGSGRRNIFVIFSPPAPSGLSGKTVRRILIFDDHPDSLRLAFDAVANLDVDFDSRRVRPIDGLAASRHTIPWAMLFSLVVILALVLALVWSLI